MVGRLRQQHKNGQFILSGKTKELYEKISFPCKLSYGEFRSLRHVSLSLVYALMINMIMHHSDLQSDYYAIHLSRTIL